MKASFTKAEDGRVGFCFEPENFQDQILLEQFTPDSERFDEFRFSVWTTATLGSTSFWGRIVTAVESSSVTVNVDAEDTAAPKTTLEIVDRPSSGVGSPVHRSLIRLDSLPAVNLRAAVLDDRTVELVRAARSVLDLAGLAALASALKRFE